jgi:hypothetical protein
MSFAEARKIEERSEFQLPNFWGHHGHEQTIDATMLRTVDWCGVGGFDPWWRRLARRTTGDFIDGGVEPGSLVYWLFAMSRTQLAIKIMPRALKLALDNIELVRTGLHPWTHWEPNAHRRRGTNEYVYEEFEDMAHASAIVFANYSLRPSNERPEELLDAAAGLLQKYQQKNGSWPYFSHDKESSVEATAMAIHALALHRPVGWERNVGRATAMLAASQEEGGYWVEGSCPDAPYLTVLVLDALELANGGRRVTFGLQGFQKERAIIKPGRKPKVPEEFVAYAGELWRTMTSRAGNNVRDDRLREIAAALDQAGHLPPAEYLEGKCGQEIRDFNSRNSNSKIGPIQTWLQLVSHGDKDHLRGMRRLLSRCSSRLDIRPLSGN